MPSRRPRLLWWLVLLGGCHAPRLEGVDQTVADFAARPFDPAPAAAGGPGSGGATPSPSGVLPVSASQVREPVAGQVSPTLRKYQLEIPHDVPGAEAPPIRLPEEKAERQRALDRLYPGLPALPEEPVALPGPNGRPYTLADLQQIAAANSPTLRQAASDVEAARGNLDQARAYPNPTMGYEAGPNNNNTATGTHGIYVDQVIKTAGKLKLQSAAAELDLRNAQLALKRARSDLATQVRTAYFNLLVARESVRVNRSLSRFTDEIFRLQTDLLRAGQAASHEPAALLAQAATIRLAYRQAIVNYAYAWKQLVATLGLPQLPLSEVEGRVDRLIPSYDYDTLRAHVLRNHTDVLTADNTFRKARYNLQLARVTAVPDVEVRADLWREFTVAPFNDFHTVSVSMPIPLWDQNRGAIRVAAAGLVRASEEPHRVEVTLSNSLATAYATYQTNVAAVEYYRRDILPNMVRYYRGVFERRKIDPNAAFADLVTAQQTLTAGVTSYLGVLGALWPAVVNVADFLQTDDLYQTGSSLQLPELPDLDEFHAWPCPHPQPVPSAVEPRPCPPPAAPVSAGTRAEAPVRASVVYPPTPVQRPAPWAGDADRTLPVLPAPPAPPAAAAPPGR